MAGLGAIKPVQGGSADSLSGGTARTLNRSAEFGQRLSAVQGALAAQGPAPKGADQQGHLMEQAQKWVSQTFFGTLLKQVRNSPFKSELFSGGRGAEAFGPLYDQHLADRMARASGRELAKSIVKHLQRPPKGAGASKGSAPAGGEDTANNANPTPLSLAA